MPNLSRLTCLLIAFLSIPVPVFAVNSVGDLKKVEKQVQDLVDKTLPCTVCIVSRSGGGSGSGVTVSEDGLVLTAAHVIPAAGEELLVIFPDGREFKAKSLGSNRLRDAGMVQITEPGSYPFVEVGNSKDLTRNDWCVSLGHAGGFQAERTPPVRLGRVLNNGSFVVTDCTIIAGDSGGPLFDIEGRVIGIHSNIGESLSQNQHVPINVFNEDWERMKRGESWGGTPQTDPRQLIMGVQLSPQPNDAGVVLAGITPNSPAERVGLETGDVIAKINDKEMKSPADIIAVVRSKAPGDKLQLKVKRDNEEKEFEIRLIRAGELMERGRRPRGRRSRERRRPPIESDSQDDAGPVDEKSINKKKESVKERPAGKSDEQQKEGDPGRTDNEKPERSAGRSIEELMRKARENDGSLELTPEERRRLRDAARSRFRNQSSQFGPGWRPPVVVTDDAWLERLMDAYEPVVAVANDSTYRVLVGGEQVALGTAVTNDTLLTKASEIEGLDFEVDVERGSPVQGQVLNVFERYDLALVQVAVSDLNPIDFSSDETKMPLGTFLASVSNATEPSAIGLISVRTREFASERGFLGVVLDKSDDGIVIRSVLKQSAADKAGLQIDDLILKLNQKGFDDLQALIKAVGANAPKQEVELFVRRGENEFAVTAELGTLPTNPRSRIERMNQMGSELSETRSGFPLALQHDCPIAPNACGGPLVNLDGECVGINIARAGRIKSYALPAYVVQELLAEELATEVPVE